jgi:PAS domain S-box-containing protein
MQTTIESIDFAISIAESVAASVDAAVVIFDWELRIRSANSAFYRAFGTSREDAQGKSLYSVASRIWDFSELRRLLRNIVADGTSFQDVEIEQDLPVLGHRLLLASGRRIDALELIVLALEDITDRVERDLRLAAIVESADDAILSKTLDGKIVSWNLGAEKMYGYSAHEVIGKAITILEPPDREGETAAILERIRRGERVSHFETKRQRKDGAIVDVSTTISPIRGRNGVITGASVIARDITEVKRSQEAAIARQKLETVGRMAGSMAHDFNNLLSAVLSNVELAQMKLSSPSPAEDELQKLRDLAIRGSETVRQLMTYAGQDAETIELVDVPQIVDEMLDLLNVSISKNAALKIELPRDLPLVRANPAQVRQIVMNLVINASEALGQAEGVIRMAASVSHIGEELSDAGAEPQARGDYLRVEVSDTGWGMTPEVQRRVFEPLFTTKAAGRGLGLAVAKRIVQSWGGAIGFQSAPGKGTTFYILLPCIGKSTTHDESGARTGTEEKPWAPGAVLVVEDEDLLRIAVSAMLRNMGFSVFAARDGSAAIDLVQEHREDIAVILLDVTLPGMTSEEVLSTVRHTRPTVRVIVTSAYSPEMVKASFPLLPLENFIRKPYTVSDLRELLRRICST